MWANTDHATQPNLLIFPPGRAALAFDTALLEALAAAPAVQLHAPALLAALQQALALLSEAGGNGSGGGGGGAGVPGVFGVQAFTSDGQTSRTTVQLFMRHRTAMQTPAWPGCLERGCRYFVKQPC